MVVNGLELALESARKVVPSSLENFSRSLVPHPTPPHHVHRIAHHATNFIVIVSVAIQGHRGLEPTLINVFSLMNLLAFNNEDTHVPIQLLILN